MFRITRTPLRDPMLDLLYNLERRMGRVFEPFGDPEWRMSEPASAWMPVVDIFEDADAVRLVAEIPGVQPKDVNISVADNVLTIHGTKLQETALEHAEKVHRYERTCGEFERSFTIPPTLDVEHIRASYGDGLLTLVLPKIEKAKPRSIKVEVTPEKALKA